MTTRTLGPSWNPSTPPVRHKPNGWTIGIAGTSEVERVFHETVSVAARSGEAPWSTKQVPRRVVGVRWTGRDTLRVTWSEDWRSQEGGSVWLGLAEGANDVYEWSWNDSEPRALNDWTDRNVRPLVDSDGTQTGVEIAGLRPGGGYTVAVQGPYRYDHDTRRWGAPLFSDVFRLEALTSSGSPVAPSNVGAQRTGPNSVRLTWRDNSNDESGFEVWGRKWSGEKPDRIWHRYGTPLQARASYADVTGLMADEEIEGTDSFGTTDSRTTSGSGWKVGGPRSVAIRSWSWPSTTTVGTPARRSISSSCRDCIRLPTQSGETTDCMLRTSPTGLFGRSINYSPAIDLDGYRVDACLETSDGARRRVWGLPA